MSTKSLPLDHVTEIATNRTGTVTAPTGAADGVALEKVAGSLQPDSWELILAHASGVGAVTLTGPVQLAVWDGTRWLYLEPLDAGGNIEVPLSAAVARRVVGVGRGQRAELLDGGIAGGGIDIELRPLEIHR